MKHHFYDNILKVKIIVVETDSTFNNSVLKYPQIQSIH